MASSTPKEGITTSLRSLEKDGDREQRGLGDEAASRDSSEINSTQHKGTFETISYAAFYSPIQQYEGKHRYDPKFQWEPKEERRLVRKVNDCARNATAQNNPKSHLLTTASVGPQDMLMGMPDVLRPST